MKLASGFCTPKQLPVHTGIKGRQVLPLIRFCFGAEWMRSVLISTSLSSLYLFLVGVTVKSAESFSAAIPLGTSTKRANSKRANHGLLRLFKMPFRPCPSSCGRFLSADDGHDRCLQCLGFQHAEDVFVDDSCTCCGHMSMTSLRSRLSFLKGLAPSTATRTGLSGSSRGPPADALGDLRVTVRASSPVCPHGPLTPHAVNVPSGSRVISLVRDGPWNTGRPAFHSMHHPMIGCRSQHRGMGLHPPDPELTAMLTRAAMSIGLEVNRPPGPEPSRLDDWILRAGHSSQPLSSPLVRSSAFFSARPSSLPSMAGLPGGTRAFPSWRER